MASHFSMVWPNKRISSQEKVIIVIPNLNASVWLYWLVF
jgi:hypothetical protein